MKKLRKLLKKLKNNKASLDNEAELLKMASFLSGFNKKFLNFIMEV